MNINKTCISIILLTLITFGVYCNSLNAPFIYDDIAKIVKNPDIKKLSNINNKLIYPYAGQKSFMRNDPSRPLTYLTFTLNYYFGKLNPSGYRLFNLLFHILNALLVFLLIKRMGTVLILSKHQNHSYVNSQKVSEPSPFFLIPFFVSLFFAIHPVNTDAVTYIFGRSNVLVTFFYILSILFFSKYSVIARPVKNRISNMANLYFILSVSCFILALASKPIAITLPAIILLFDYMKDGDGSKKPIFIYHLTFWLIALIYLLFRVFYLGDIGDIDSFSPWNSYTYFITQPYVIMNYLKFLLVPAGLCIDHCIIPPKTIFELKILISFFMLLFIFIMILRLRKSKIILFCAGWFFITLAPTTSFFPTTRFISERRLYLSGFVIFFLIVFFIFKLKSRKKFLSVIIGIYLVFLGATTWKRNKLYMEPVLLWSNVVNKYPNNECAFNNLGLLYMHKKNYSTAEKAYKRALELKPDYAKAHYNLGLLYEHTQIHNKALKEYTKAIEINPVYAEAHHRLCNLYFFIKEYDKAYQEIIKALEIKPDFVEARYTLGLFLYVMKRYNEAADEYKKAVNLNPDFHDAHFQLGTVYFEQKQFKDALKEFKIALALRPDNKSAKEKIKECYLKKQY